VASDITLLDRFRAMVTMRAFEEACASGIPTGELRGELHLASGQEGVAAGMLGVLRPDDWMVSTHRSHQHAIAKGVPLRPMMAEIFEKRTGLCGGKGGHVHLFDLDHRFSVTGIVGSSLPVALGHAYASRLEGADYVAIGITGDGGTNAGQFHETMNMAAIWSLPMVVLVENNHYAISVPAEDVIAGDGIAERAAAYGAWGRRVDGTDVEATAEAFADAVAHARAGHGPALLEATCFRFRGHYEGDIDHYRSEADRKRWLEQGDPLVIARRRLLERGEADEHAVDAVEREARAEIDSVLQEVRESPAPDPSEASRDVFVEGVV
jgi:TPP-dependent pyruvate/acetoin dehydrogenase alpha subunit